MYGMRLAFAEALPSVLEICEGEKMKKLKRIGWVPWCVKAGPDGNQLGPWTSCFHSDKDFVLADAIGYRNRGDVIKVAAVYVREP